MSGSSSKPAVKVGDTIEIPDPSAILTLPTGEAVTARRSYVVREAGDYKVHVSGKSRPYTVHVEK